MGSPMLCLSKTIDYRPYLLKYGMSTYIGLMAMK